MTVEACNAWRETIDAEKEHRRRSQARLGMRRPSPRAAAPQFAQQFSSPRSTAKEATVLAKQPGRPPLEQFIPNSSDVPNTANNRQKNLQDYNSERGDHNIFPPVGALEDPRQGRQRIRELKAQVNQEKQVRREAESRLQWHE